MNKLTVLKATLGAAAIVALGATASLAANTNNLEVTVTPVQSLTLVSTCVIGTPALEDCATAFDVAGTMVRGGNSNLVNADEYVSSLDYITDWDDVAITATLDQTDAGHAALAGDGDATKLSITVAAADPTDVGPGRVGGTEAAPVFQSETGKILIDNIDGHDTQVTANSVLSFHAAAGYSAPWQASTFTSVYSITSH
jgi:hypothetical protein